MSKSDQSYDYIVVGAGSAGCVLANRLSADPNNRVLLLEAGGSDINPWIHIPVGYFKTMHHPATDWCYKTEPDPGVAGRRLQWPCGKVLGGSSSINGLLYVRGQLQDYDRWAEMGNKGWSFEEVLPYFKKSEDQERGADEYHGVGGLLKVSDLRLRRPIADFFIKAATQIASRSTRITTARSRRAWAISSRRHIKVSAGARPRAFFARHASARTSVS